MKNAKEFEQTWYNYLSDQEKKLIEDAIKQLMKRHKHDSWEDFYTGVISYIEFCMMHILIDDSYLEELAEENDEVL